MGEVMEFKFESSGVRVVQDDKGEPWWVAKDVCDVLGIANYRDAASALDEDERGYGKTDTLGGEQEMLTVSESGLYTLIIRSNKPKARAFRKWVTAEVLPSIRKTGAYRVPGALSTEEVIRLANLPRQGHMMNHDMALQTMRMARRIAVLPPEKQADVYREYGHLVRMLDRQLSAPVADRDAPVLAFLAECCDFDSEQRTAPQILYRTYLAWCFAHRAVDRLGKIHFYRRVLKLWPKLARTKCGKDRKEYFFGLVILPAGKAYRDKGLRVVSDRKEDERPVTETALGDAADPDKGGDQ